ncbi:hypothetical protein EGM51_12080 [Verrucomicrobia bacterium S94]|nr:hypothetical protein EGM51_12080 [Verrucomicrobia bacterium S94]
MKMRVISLILFFSGVTQVFSTIPEGADCGSVVSGLKVHVEIFKVTEEKIVGSVVFVNTGESIIWFPGIPSGTILPDQISVRDVYPVLYMHNIQKEYAYAEIPLLFSAELFPKTSMSYSFKIDRSGSLIEMQTGICARIKAPKIDARKFAPFRSTGKVFTRIQSEAVLHMKVSEYEKINVRVPPVVQSPVHVVPYQRKQSWEEWKKEQKKTGIIP